MDEALETMNDIFDHKIVNVEKLKSLDNGFDVAEFTLDNGETIEAPVKFVFPNGGDLDQ